MMRFRSSRSPSRTLKQADGGHYGINQRVVVDVFSGPEDVGLVRAAERVFVWQRSEDGWTDAVEKLNAMETGAGHQYLDGPRDDVQVMASIGEYGGEWWRRSESD